MDTRNIIFIGAAALFALACSKELAVVEENPTAIEAAAPEKAPASSKITRFYASFDSSGDNQTRVYLDEERKMHWNHEDLISIFNMSTVNDPYSFDGKDGDRSGSFSEAEGQNINNGGNGEDIDKIYAVYPYSPGTNFNKADGSVIVNLPSEQAYAEKSFGQGANTMISVGTGSNLQFKNVGGYLLLKLYGNSVKVSSVSVKSNGGEIIAGEANVTFDDSGIPSATLSSQGSDEITINCGTGVVLGTSSSDYTEFWFVIPPVTFSKGFTVTVTGANGKTFEKATQRASTIDRNVFMNMPAFEVTFGSTNQIGDGEEQDGGTY